MDSSRTFRHLKTLLAAVVAFSAIPGYAGNSEYIWSDDKGALPASECSAVQADAASLPFKVLYKTRGEAGDYVMVSQDRKLLVKNLTLLAVVPSRTEPPWGQSILKVVSAPPRVSYGDDAAFAARGVQVYLRTPSLRAVSEFTLYINGSSAKVTGGAVTKIGSGETPLAGSRWKLATHNGSPVVFTCPSAPNAKYYAFDMTPAGSKTAVLRMGIKFSETQIFSTASVDTAALLEQGADPNLWTNLTTLMGLGDSNQIQTQPPKTYEDDEVNRENGEQRDDGEGDPANAGTPSTGVPQAAEGSDRLIVCDGDGINVRDEAISAQELFRSRPFERIFIKSVFNKPGTKQGVVKGKTFTFKRVQFIDRVGAKATDDVTGWINQDFISTEAGCKAFQDSLKNVVCIKSGKQWVRDAQNEELFPLKPLEDIIRKPDWKERTDKRTIDGKTYDFIPVIVPSENNAEGWIALDSLLPESECIAKREEMVKSGKGLDDPNCCTFPLEKNPTYDYTVDKHFNRWFGGDRSGRKHAACDLFQPPGSNVRAVTAGIVDSNPAVFTRRKSGVKSYDFSIKHTGGKIIRYGEVTSIPSKMRIGKAVASEEKLGVVSYTQMLHLELYKGTGSGPLTVYPERNKRGKIVEKNSIILKFQRRPDLIDPTSYLLKWEKDTFGKVTVTK